MARRRRRAPRRPGRRCPRDQVRPRPRRPPRRPAPRSSDLTEAITCAPAAAASWIANVPTPPYAPVISTRLPSSEPQARSARSAAIPATGNAAAAQAPPTREPRPASRHSPRRDSAKAPSASATARVPTAGPEPSCEPTTTTPARSEPSTAPVGVVEVAAVERDMVDPYHHTSHLGSRVGHLAYPHRGGRCRIGNQSSNRHFLPFREQESASERGAHDRPNTQRGEDARTSQMASRCRSP